MRNAYLPVAGVAHAFLHDMMDEINLAACQGDRLKGFCFDS